MFRRPLGILGGMGSLAAAEFLKTIYELNMSDVEQDSPFCVLYSDPAIPDRTDAILKCSYDALLHHFVKALQGLSQQNCKKVVIACVTMHYFLPRISEEMKDDIVSLIDVTMDEVLFTKEQALLLCSNGTREGRMFQQHDQWERIARYVQFPDADDQHTIHDLIYRLKKNAISDSAVVYFGELARKYRVKHVIAGCTEFHLVTKYRMNHECARDYHIIDPLLAIARDLKRFIDV